MSKIKLTHPADPKASVETTDEYADMYESQGWKRPAAKAATAPRKRAAKKAAEKPNSK